MLHCLTGSGNVHEFAKSNIANDSVNNALYAFINSPELCSVQPRLNHPLSTTYQNF